ncbi:MAG: hypothetical protein ACI4WS_08445 [Oscillospiraceae bacterium]
MTTNDGARVLVFEKSNSISNSSDGYTDTLIVRTNEKVNLTGYTKLRLTMFLGKNLSGLTGRMYFKIGEPAAAEQKTAYDFSDWQLVDGNAAFVSSYDKPGSFADIDIDISELSGEQYLNFAVYHGTENTVYTIYAYIKEIKLMR